MLVFEERGKLEYPEKNLSEQSREPTNSAHIWRESGNRTRDTLVEGARSHHCANPAPLTCDAGASVLVQNEQIYIEIPCSLLKNL